MPTSACDTEIDAVGLDRKVAFLECPPAYPEPVARVEAVETHLRAMDNRHFSLLAHPTGRVLETRGPYDVDMLRLIRHARDRGCALELNAHPERLDLLDTWCMTAREEGVPVAINSDAHSVHEFANLRFGVGQARRGWLEAKDVLNTRPLAALLAFLQRASAREVR